MEVVWENRNSYSSHGSEYRLIVNGESTTYVVAPWYNEYSQLLVTIFAGGVVVKSEISIDDVKKWCEREYKLRLLENRS